MSKCPLAISKYLPKCPVTTLKYVVGAAVAIKVVTTTLAVVKAANRRKAAEKRMKEQEPNTVTVFMFPKPKLVESPVSLAGPAAAVETFLRLFKVKYTIVESMDPEESPSGRLPYAEINGKQIPESSFIINAAKVLPGVKLPTLTAEQHAIGHSVRRVVTETFRLGFYRYLMVDRPDICVSRFVDFKALSYPSWLLNILIRRMFRPNVIKMLNLHGYGDLWYDEYHREMMDDLNAVEALLSRSSFLFGEEPSEYDCYVFGFLYQLRAMPSAASYPALDHVRTSPVIKAYLDRIVKLAGYTELPVV